MNEKPLENCIYCVCVCFYNNNNKNNFNSSNDAYKIKCMHNMVSILNIYSNEIRSVGYNFFCE